MNQERSFWILAEQDIKTGRIAPMTDPRYKNMARWWGSLEEAYAFFVVYEKQFWESFVKANPKSPINRSNKPWKSFALHVKNLPNSKWLNQNFISKHILDAKEFTYESPDPMKALGFGSTDGYGDGYGDGYSNTSSVPTIDTNPGSFLY